MKVYIVLTLCAILLGCDSSGTGNDKLAASNIVGFWSWAHSDGGYSGNDHYYPKGNETLLIQFTADGKFNVWGNDTLMESAIYTVNPNDTTLIFTHVDTSLTLHDRQKFHQVYFVPDDVSRLNYHGDSISFEDNVYDGLGHLYKRAFEEV